MANREVRFRKSEIKRAIEGVKLAGYDVAGVNMHADGSYTVVTGKPAEQPLSPPNDADEWKMT